METTFSRDALLASAQAAVADMQTRIFNARLPPAVLLSITASSLIDAQVQLTLFACLLGLVLVLWALGFDRTCTSVVLLAVTSASVVAICESELYFQASEIWRPLSSSQFDVVGVIANEFGMSVDVTSGAVVVLSCVPLWIAQLLLRSACGGRARGVLGIMSACVLVLIAHDTSLWTTPDYVLALGVVALVPAINSGLLFRAVVALMLSWVLRVHSSFGSVTTSNLQTSIQQGDLAICFTCSLVVSGTLSLIFPRRVSIGTLVTNALFATTAAYVTTRVVAEVVWDNTTSAPTTITFFPSQRLTHSTWPHLRQLFERLVLLEFPRFHSYISGQTACANVTNGELQDLLNQSIAQGDYTIDLAELLHASSPMLCIVASLASVMRLIVLNPHSRRKIAYRIIQTACGILLGAIGWEHTTHETVDMTSPWFVSVLLACMQGSCRVGVAYDHAIHPPPPQVLMKKKKDDPAGGTLPDIDRENNTSIGVSMPRSVGFDALRADSRVYGAEAKASCAEATLRDVQNDMRSDPTNFLTIDAKGKIAVARHDLASALHAVTLAIRTSIKEACLERNTMREVRNITRSKGNTPVETKRALQSQVEAAVARCIGMTHEAKQATDRARAECMHARALMEEVTSLIDHRVEGGSDGQAVSVHNPNQTDNARLLAIKKGLKVRHLDVLDMLKKLDNAEEGSVTRDNVHRTNSVGMDTELGLSSADMYENNQNGYELHSIANNSSNTNGASHIPNNGGGTGSEQELTKRPVEEKKKKKNDVLHSILRKRGTPRGSPAKATIDSQLIAFPLSKNSKDFSSIPHGKVDSKRNPLQISTTKSLDSSDNIVVAGSPKSRRNWFSPRGSRARSKERAPSGARAAAATDSDSVISSQISDGMAASIPVDTVVKNKSRFSPRGIRARSRERRSLTASSDSGGGVAAAVTAAAFPPVELLVKNKGRFSLRAARATKKEELRAASDSMDDSSAHGPSKNGSDIVKIRSRSPTFSRSEGSGVTSKPRHKKSQFLRRLRGKSSGSAADAASSTGTAE